MIDAHSHLQYLNERVGLGGLRAISVRSAIVNGTEPDDWANVHKLAVEGNGVIFTAYGLHPWKIKSAPEGWLMKLRGWLKSEAQAVGEVGLDKCLDVPMEEQVFILEQQLELAEEFNLPVCLHIVQAWGKILDLIRSGAFGERGFMIHDYSGSIDSLQTILDYGGYVSFSKNVGQANRMKMRDALKFVPLDRLLIESDFPLGNNRLEESKKDMICYGQHLKDTYRIIAEARGLSSDQLQGQVLENYLHLFADPL